MVLTLAWLINDSTTAVGGVKEPLIDDMRSAGFDF